ncbi:hypothetical protein [Streptomyces globisporus]|nr:hypothetical protein [Streptomyces globisporus]
MAAILAKLPYNRPRPRALDLDRTLAELRSPLICGATRRGPG